MFSYKKQRSIYLYIMNVCSSVGTRTLSLPRPYSFLSIILYLYTEMRTPFPHLTFPATFLPFPYVPYILFYYILYIQRGAYFPATFYPFPILLLYSYYIQKREHFPRPFLPLYKVNAFYTAPFFTFLIVWEKFAGKSF